MEKKALYTIINRMAPEFRSNLLYLLFGFLFVALFSSCEKNEEIVITMGAPIELSTVDQEIVLHQKRAYNTALELIWTTGSNQGTGASISYTLQMDLEGNNFSKSKTSDLGKGIYNKGIGVAELNDWMLNDWGRTPNEPAVLQARVIANVANETVLPDTSEVVAINVTPYDPVTSNLYLIGDASPSGWDAANAAPLEMDADDPTIFTYNGPLSTGEFKFITTLGTFLPSYNKGEEDTQLVYRTEDSQPDDKFMISETGKYLVTVDLIELTISIEQQAGPAYDALYIVGDASPSGWNIGSPEAFTQDPDNLFVFTYEAVLTPGAFKISTFTGDWCDGDWINASQPDQVLTATDFIFTHGCDGPDNKWLVTEETQGKYTITVNLDKNTISIEPFKLYMVGSATPVGWDIGSAIELVQDETNWYIFRYEGPLVEGEFKFPVNRNSDWGQDMYMKDPGDPSKMYLHKGGDPDDEKWTISASEAGDYIITVNVQDLTIDVQKQ